MQPNSTHRAFNLGGGRRCRRGPTSGRRQPARFIRAFILGFLAPLIAFSPTEAGSYKWYAASHTASAITGDISVSADSITFANGKRIHIVPVGPDKPHVFALRPRANPTLLNGNKLCGGTPPDFIVLIHNGDDLYLKVFDGPQVPQGRADPLPEPGTCATYNFVHGTASGAAPPHNSAYALLAIDGSGENVRIDFGASLDTVVAALMRTSSYEWAYDEFERLLSRYGKPAVRAAVVAALRASSNRELLRAHRQAASDALSPLSELNLPADLWPAANSN